MNNHLRQVLALSLVLTTFASSALADKHPSRSSASKSVNRGNNNNSNRNVNRNNNTNVNRNTNVNTNVNRNTNVNVNRDVNVNVNHGYNNGCCYNNRNGWGVAAAVATTAVVTAAVVGSRVTVLPPSCTVVIANGITYQQCGGAYYQPQISGGSTTYVVVNSPY